eukprot:COSAG03_NODE_220_length_10399_cov_58.299806_10_plen_66_part_00
MPSSSGVVLLAVFVRDPGQAPKKHTNSTNTCNRCDSVTMDRQVAFHFWGTVRFQPDSKALLWIFD